MPGTWADVVRSMCWEEPEQYVHLMIEPKKTLIGQMKTSNRFGENGHRVVSEDEFEDCLLTLFFKLVRGQTRDAVTRMVRTVLWRSLHDKDPTLLRDLFLLAFQTRSCRGGKGERQLFYWLIQDLFKAFPCIVLDLLDLIPMYGYWKDLFLLLEDCLVKDSAFDWSPLQNGIWDLCAKQHRLDLEALEATPKVHLSLYGKYVPSQKSHFDKKLGAVSEVSKRVYGDVEEKKMLFRKDVTRMRAALYVTEQLMCNKEYSKIRFDAVSSVCLSKFSCAFLNEVKGMPDEPNGNRFPHDQDRVQARKNLIKLVTSPGRKVVNGAQLYPHELVANVVTETSTVRKFVINAQWKAMRESVEKQIQARKEIISDQVGKGLTNKPIDLGNVVVMADVSGSMLGRPMDVAIGMGILCSEIVHPSFRNLVMTFSRSATWVPLNESDSFHAKVSALKRAPWGMNTNFYKALQRIGQVVKVNRLKQEEIPNLLVVSDMQFDEAGRSSFAADEIAAYFAALGHEVQGAPFEPPTIIFWNVRDSVGFPAKASTPGVVLVSGYSPSLFKFLLSGELQEEVVQVEEDTGMVNVIKRKLTARDLLAKALEDPHLDSVRERLSKFDDTKYLLQRCKTFVLSDGFKLR